MRGQEAQNTTSNNTIRGAKQVSHKWRNGEEKQFDHDYSRVSSQKNTRNRNLRFWTVTCFMFTLQTLFSGALCIIRFDKQQMLRYGAPAFKIVFL